MITVTVGAATDVGRVREHNEDAHVVGRRTWAVADGMGGHAAGEVASAVAVKALASLDEGDAPTRERVVEGVRRANEAILAHGRRHWLTRGMATTVTGAVLGEQEGGECLLVFNVGDSRTYELADGAFRQVTVDHSEVQELVDEGLITPAEARVHPMRNIVTQCLGARQAPTPDTFAIAPAPGTRLVICSDGLSGEVDDDGIEQILLSHPEPQAAADALVAAALDAGGHDNVTVIVLNVGAA